jgi:hypothetical protein
MYLLLFVAGSASPASRSGSGPDDTGEAGDTEEAVDTAPPGPPAACTAWGEPVTTGTVSDPELDEISGVAPSVKNPGVLWVIEDRNNPAVVTGIDERGDTVVTVDLEGVQNEDMGDVDVVPCGDTTCIVVADTGDNGRDRPEAAIVVVEEPVVGEERVTLPATRYALQWPDGPEDNEALTHTDDGRLVFATKRNDFTTVIYTLAAFTEGAVPERVAVLPTAEADYTGGGTQVTAISLWPDQTRFLIRTYRKATELVLDGGIDHVRSAPEAAIPWPVLDHVEGVAYDPVWRGYWTVPESTPDGPSPVVFVPCTEPAA